MISTWRRSLEVAAWLATAGFGAGAIAALLEIRANRYVAHAMWRLVLEVLQDRLLLGLVVGFGCGLLVAALDVLLRRIAARRHEPRRAHRLLWAVVICGSAYPTLLWIANQFFLPHRFHPASLVADGLITVASVLVFVALSRLDWPRAVNALPSLRVHRLATLLVVGVVLLLLISNVTAPRPTGPDLILITVDTLRADHLGSYGYERDTSPNIDRFADESLLFENNVSHAPVTSSSFSSILSGLLPHETGVFRNDRLPWHINTLAEYLRNAGYRTQAIIGNFVLRKSRRYGQGFEVYDDEMQQFERVRGLAERIAPATADAAIEALRRLQERPEQRFFLWVHFQDPHGPYTAPESASGIPPLANTPRPMATNETISGEGGIPSYQQLGEEIDYHHYVSEYDREIRFFDLHFGRLMDEIRRLGLYDTALIVFTSDHGEAMGEHDYYFAHGEHLYQGLIHVPLVVRWAGRAQSGRRSDFVQHSDLVPTILGFLSVPATAGLRGRDLTRGPGDPRALISQMRRQDGSFALSIIIDGLKMIHEPGVWDYALFDLEQDPLEQIDLSGDPAYRDAADQLRRQLDTLRNEGLGSAAPAGEAPDLSEEEIERLRALGYLD
jgi:arylsulfatase